MRELYESVRSCLEEAFKRFGDCNLEVTADKIPERMKSKLDDYSLYYIRIEKQLPDIMGFFIPTMETKCPYALKLGGLVIIEVKNNPP